MGKSGILKNTENFVKKELGKEGTGHDWWHVERVRNNARLINKQEKADWFIVELAVLLHDVGDRKVTLKEENDHSPAKEFLEKQKVSGDVIDQVMFIIENMPFSKSVGQKRKSQSLEFQVVQDADRLDALGAIGIARAFVWGGSRARPIYDPTKRARKITSPKMYRKINASTFHHFEEKVLRLKDLMNTKTAKKVAKGRHDFVVSYMKQFLEEWEGRK